MVRKPSLAFGCLVLLVASCSRLGPTGPADSPDPRQRILGKWSSSDGVLEFLPNGDYVWDKARPGTFSSKYRFLDDETVELQMKWRTQYVYYGPGKGRTDLPSSITSTESPRRRKVKVSRDTLELVDPDANRGSGTVFSGGKFYPDAETWQRIK